MFFVVVHLGISVVFLFPLTLFPLLNAEQHVKVNDYYRSNFLSEVILSEVIFVGSDLWEVILWNKTFGKWNENNSKVKILFCEIRFIFLLMNHFIFCDGDEKKLNIIKLNICICLIWPGRTSHNHTTCVTVLSALLNTLASIRVLLEKTLFFGNN